MAARLGSPPHNLHGFPSYVLPEVIPLLRVHQSAYGPWWFASGTGARDEGRFDLPVPSGTCYVAEQAYGAFLEAFQDWIDAASPIPAAVVQRRCISTLHLPAAARVADCLAEAARSFGVTSEMHTSKDRALTQEWAAAFFREGFDGIRYFASNDPSMSQVSVALFGDAGAQLWPVAATYSIPGTFLLEIERRFGVQVR